MMIASPRLLSLGNRSLLVRSCRYFSSTTTSDGPSSFVLSHPSTVDHGQTSRGRVIAITSGKGGVGKTTVSASFALGLASRGKKTCVVDFDIGLRNLDIHLGMERRVVFDMVHCLMEECQIHQALIKDKKREPNLSLLAASQTRDKEVLTVAGVERILAELTNSFDCVVLDSPAGIESGARHAMFFADDAIIVANPELSSCRDADKMVGFIDSKSRRAELGPDECLPVSMTLLINRYDAERAQAEESLAINDMTELLGLPVVGVIPESRDVLPCTNLGNPVITLPDNVPASGAFHDMVDRFLGEEKELRFTTPEPVSFFKKLFG
ncbi:determining protein MinD [Seminavis robusta]|uniref:Determining protein MinD n=1 Tax=Seminavis robusta TaxID=568900 RepID=A0A9N8DXC4_9STRA|nr:determining protein MinD [Seminavis robusta]|eukprot:Sro447_g144950.1 determining protein MinD (324) ;mRNA; f:49626-50597